MVLYVHDTPFSITIIIKHTAIFDPFDLPDFLPLPLNFNHYQNVLSEKCHFFNNNTFFLICTLHLWNLVQALQTRSTSPCFTNLLDPPVHTTLEAASFSYCDRVVSATRFAGQTTKARGKN